MLWMLHASVNEGVCVCKGCFEWAVLPSNVC